MDMDMRDSGVVVAVVVVVEEVEVIWIGLD